MDLTAGVLARDLLHEAREVGAAVAVAQCVRDLADGDLQRSEEVEHAVALVVVRLSGGALGSGICVRSSAWMDAFSSTLRTTACIVESCVRGSAGQVRQLRQRDRELCGGHSELKSARHRARLLQYRRPGFASW